MSKSSDSYFIPERPSLAELESRQGVEAIMGKAERYLAERGAECYNCGQGIDSQDTFSFILGQPAPRFACSKPACMERLQRLSENVSAPMIMARPSSID
jgi:hypothetical protein